MITFYDSNKINTANINTADEELKSQIKKISVGQIQTRQVKV